jgi:hypothetical protein
MHSDQIKFFVSAIKLDMFVESTNGAFRGYWASEIDSAKLRQIELGDRVNRALFFENY